LVTLAGNRDSTQQSGDVTTYSLQTHIDHHLAGRLTDADAFRCEFARTAYEVLLTALEHLDAVPRTEPFWRNTNGNPTLTKLDDYCRELVAGHHHANWAHKTLAYLKSFFYCSNDFGSEHFAELFTQGDTQPETITVAAFYVYSLTGYDTSDELGRLLARLGLKSRVPALVNSQSQSADVWVQKWAETVIESSVGESAS